jgi:hypothetical protein
MTLVGQSKASWGCRGRRWCATSVSWGGRVGCKGNGEERERERREKRNRLVEAVR